MYDLVLRFWTCDLTGEKCATILRNGEEICVTADEAYDIEAKSQARHDAYELQCEIG